MAFGRTANPDKEAERLERDRQNTAVRAQRDEFAATQKATKEQIAATQKAAKADEAAAKAALRETENAAKQAAAAEKAFQASPVGRATTAAREGAGFFHLQLEMSEIGRSGADIFGYTGGVGVERKRGGHTDVLSQIEDVGWHLDNVGYVYMETGQISRDKLLSSGQEVATLGKTVGHFLFRRAEPAALTPGS